jgi:hypothetical protein
MGYKDIAWELGNEPNSLMVTFFQLLVTFSNVGNFFIAQTKLLLYE